WQCDSQRLCSSDVEWEERTSCGGIPLPKPRKSPKLNASNDEQGTHATTGKPEKLGSGSTPAVQPQEVCALIHPVQGVSSNHPQSGWELICWRIRQVWGHGPTLLPARSARRGSWDPFRCSLHREEGTIASGRGVSRRCRRESARTPG